MTQIKVKRGNPIFRILINIVLIVFSVICIYPGLYVIFASFSEPQQLDMHAGLLLHPLGFTLKGYEVAMSYNNIGTGYLNTFFVAGVGTCVNMFLTILGAFALSRRNIMLKRPIMLMITFTMFFSGGMIPTYLQFKQLGLIDSLWVSLFSLPSLFFLPAFLPVQKLLSH